jgi:hypothetical protein
LAFGARPDGLDRDSKRDWPASPGFEQPDAIDPWPLFRHELRVADDPELSRKKIMGKSDLPLSAPLPEAAMPLAVTFHRQNQPPFIISGPTGSVDLALKKPYTFAAVAGDPDGDSCAFQFECLHKNLLFGCVCPGALFRLDDPIQPS